MKKAILSIGCLLYSLKGFSAEPVAKLTIVEGHVYNRTASPESKTIIVNIPDISGRYDNTRYFTQVDKNNNFKITFTMFVAQDAQLIQEGLSTQPLIRNFIIHPGDKVHINLDFKNLTHITFAGSTAKTNNDLYNYHSTPHDVYEANGMYRVTDAVKYKEAIIALRTELQRRETAYVDSVHANHETREWLENNITINYYNWLSGFYTRNHRSDAQQNEHSAYVAITADDVDRIFTTTINAEGYWLLAALMPTIDNEIIYNKYSPKYLAAIDDTAKKYNSKLLADLLRGTTLRSTLNDVNTADFYKNKDVFDGIKEPYIKAALARRYKIVAYDNQEHKKGISAFSQSLKGTLAGALIDSLVNVHKNKVIYVDFWATWCGPCRAEMPNSKKLAEKYRDKDVAFAYLCTRSPKDLWKTVSAELAVGGDQIYCNDKLSESLGKALKIHAIPFYMLINKNGEIVEAGNYGLRPANYFTERKIKTLLE